MSQFGRRDFAKASAAFAAAVFLPGGAVAAQAGATSPDKAKMAAVVHAYIAAFERGSLDGIVALFSEDATVEDPVGGTVQKGREAIRAFYKAPVAVGAKLKLEGPIRIAGAYAAFPFSVTVKQGSATMVMDVIDTFRFNERNEVIEMRAYWGPENRRMG